MGHASRSGMPAGYVNAHTHPHRRGFKLASFGSVQTIKAGILRAILWDLCVKKNKKTGGVIAAHIAAGISISGFISSTYIYKKKLLV